MQSGKSEFEKLVEAHYVGLYQFAFSLTRSESDACDYTQQTFLVWAQKGHQLRDTSKAKTWLYTTLHRLFLERVRHSNRFVHEELESVEFSLPVVEPGVVKHADGIRAVEFLAQVDEVYRGPVSLFFLEDYSYQEIADILEVPLGTVKSRISRGVAQLQRAMSEKSRGGGPWKGMT